VSDALPGQPWPKLRAAWEQAPSEVKPALLTHLTGTTPAEWLEDWFGRAGTPISASAIRTYRRSLRLRGQDVQV
jgi:hypothetical protein